MIKTILLSTLFGLNVFASEGSTTDFGAAELLTTNAADPKCISLNEETSLCSKSNQGYFAVYAIIKKGTDGLWRVEGKERVVQLDSDK